MIFELSHKQKDTIYCGITLYIIGIVSGILFFFSIYGGIYEPWINNKWYNTSCIIVEENYDVDKYFNNYDGVYYDSTIVRYIVKDIDKDIYGTACANKYSQLGIGDTYLSEYPYKRSSKLYGLMRWTCAKCDDGECGEWININQTIPCQMTVKNTHTFNKQLMRDATFQEQYYDKTSWNILLVCPMLVMLIFVFCASQLINITIFDAISSHQIDLVVRKNLLIFKSLIDDLFFILLTIIIIRWLNFTPFKETIYLEILFSYFFWTISCCLYLARIVIGFLAICHEDKWSSVYLPVIGLYSRFRMSKNDFAKYSEYLKCIIWEHVFLEYIPQLISISIFLRKRNKNFGAIDWICTLFILPTCIIHMLYFIHYVVILMHPQPKQEKSNAELDKLKQPPEYNIAIQ